MIQKLHEGCPYPSSTTHKHLFSWKQGEKQKKKKHIYIYIYILSISIIHSNQQTERHTIF
ncbi:BnaC03g23830D [Brassica napus]|uniref:(rape) hypothetical protein n=1 Tax=Brassica napus TaxID=3708 RepID=A0A078I146_BRANA|nr:unnamed protein product [Brassica napus]CDY42823.1 BnaC03g23830D [Brassica napus]